jgi:hypothetical protein
VAVWGASETDVWAFGYGVILHWDGNAWTSTTSPTTQALRAVWGSGPDDIWAFGNQGAIVHKTAAGWALHSTMSSINFARAWGADAQHVWAVGSSEAIIFFDGNNWSAPLLPRMTGNHFESVWGTSATDVWVVGGNSSDDRQLRFHWNGLAWSEQPNVVATGLHAMAGGAPGEIWAAAHRKDFEGGTMWRFANGTWAPFDDMLEARIVAMDGTPARGLWASGWPGLLMTWNGSAWVNPFGKRSRAHLHGAWSPGGNDGWAVGMGGTILRWNGADWQIAEAGTGYFFEGLLAVHGSSPTNVYAAGHRGLLRRWDGVSWTTVGPPSSDVYVRVWVSGPNDVWLGTTNNRVLRWNGQTMTYLPAIDAIPTGFWQAGPDDMWVLTGRTTAWRWTGGPIWTQVIANGGVSAMWGSAPDNAWAIGGLGVIQRWNGEAFGTPLLPKVTTLGLNRIAASGPSDIWVGGEAGTVLHYDGTSWKAQVADPMYYMQDIMVTGPGDAQVVTEGGGILRRRP